MNLISSSFGRNIHPRYLISAPCMRFEFSGGYRATLFNDGLLFPLGKNGNALSGKATKIEAAMKAAITKRFPHNPLTRSAS